MDADAVARPDEEQPDDEASLEDLLPIVRRGLASADHVALLGLASATLAVILHAPAPGPRPGEDDADRVIEEVVRRYLDHGSRESLVYAAAMTALLPSGSLRSGLRVALDGAEAELPSWLAAVDRSLLESPTVVRDLFDDDEWLLAGVHLAEGGRLSFRISVDHGADGAVDAALMGQTVAEVRDQLGASSPDEVSLTDVAASELATRYADAMTVGAAVELDGGARSDTWPSSRPLIEWALRLSTDADAPGD